MKLRCLLGVAAVVTCVALLGTGCERLGKKSPQQVVQAFFAAGNAGKYSEAEQYLTPSAKAMMVLAGGIKKFVDHETKDGKIDRVEILTVETRGEGAKITYKIHYKDGETKNDDVSLIIENGEWRIAG